MSQIVARIGFSMGELPVLVPYIPTENPRLRDTAYEVALVALTTNPSFHKDLLSTVKSWPPVIYSALPVISAIGPQLNTSSMTDALGEALAELYVIDGRYEKAFALYADLMKPDIFDFLEKHNLHDALHEKVVQLMMTDCKRAVPLLTQHRDLITTSKVVSQLLAAGNKCDSRYFLHLYLLLLFEANRHAGRDFHDMQIRDLIWTCLVIWRAEASSFCVFVHITLHVFWLRCKFYIFVGITGHVSLSAVDILFLLILVDMFFVDIRRRVW
ncbi:hypothetical protein ACSBR1_041822 [Camellia fascicularis]